MICSGRLSSRIAVTVIIASLAVAVVVLDQRRREAERVSASLLQQLQQTQQAE